MHPANPTQAFGFFLAVMIVFIMFLLEDDF